MNKLKLTLATLLAVLAFNVNAMEPNKLKQCEPEIKADIQSYQQLGFKHGKIADLLYERAAKGEVFNRCLIDTEGFSGITSATCSAKECTVRYYGWYVRKAL